MSRRVNEDIFGRTWSDNADVLGAFDGGSAAPGFEGARERFAALRAELSDAASTPLRRLDPSLLGDATDGAEWDAIVGGHADRKDTWLSAPWCTTEFYAYRRLMEAVGYFEVAAATHRWDVFRPQKRAGLEGSPPAAESVLGRCASLPAGADGDSVALAVALWGNQMDLSIWPAGTGGDRSGAFGAVLARAADHLLWDDSASVCSVLSRMRAAGGGRADVVVDNAGFELVTDLALADHLVTSGAAGRVTFRVKAHPTFVSDALENDLVETCEHYAALDPAEFPACARAGRRWMAHLASGAWVCKADNFWVQPQAMWGMPQKLRDDLATGGLTVVKGDANYRRLLGDRTWDASADSFEDVVGAYFPCPVVALRTLKAEVACGLDKEKSEKAASEDKEWMCNGKYGVVHFGKGVGA